jgi:DNA repair photolyase
MILNLLNLLGILPQHIEITANPCNQGCEYCYAKIWKREFFSAEKILNNIINESNKKEGLLGFYLRKKEPIALSNRSDILCHPEWENLLRSIKRLGHPLYLETKGNKEMLKLTDFLTEKDEIYMTITSAEDNQYEEKNILKNAEKVEMARDLRGKGVSVVVGVNPYMREKTSIKQVIKMAERINPSGMVIRPYHGPTRNKLGNIYVKDLYRMKEDKTDQTEKDIIKISEELLKMNIPVDANPLQKNLKYYKDRSLVLKLRDNEKMFSGGSLVCDEELCIMAEKEAEYREQNFEYIEFWFEDFIEDFKHVLDYHEGAIVKKSDINSRSMSKVEIPDRMDYKTALKLLWNNYNLFQKTHGYWKDYKDNEGNLVLNYKLEASA